MLFVVIVFASTAPAAQQSSPAFEAASIRRNMSGSPPKVEFQPNRFVATTMPLRWLVAVAYEPRAPDLFLALREQLGLKLEPVTTPIEVLVIESVQQPTAN
jgi:hypothetical protein